MMLGRLPRLKRNLVLLGIGLLVLWFSWSIRSVLNPLLIGYLCAYILHPFVVRVEQLGMSKRSAVNLIYFSSFVLAGVLSLVIVHQMSGLAHDVVDGITAEPEIQQPGEPGEPPAAEVVSVSKAEAFVARVNSFIGTVNEWTRAGLPLIDRDILGDDLGGVALGFLKTHGGEAGRMGLTAAQRTWGFVSRFVGGIIAVGGLFLLVPLYTYYLLFELGRLHGFVRRYLPKRDREHLTEVADKIGAVIASFFRGRLAVCFLKGLFLSVGLWIAGIEHSFLFGMLSGFLSLIPFFGPFIGFVLATAAGILDHSVISSLVRAGIVFGLGEVLEGYVLIPKVLGDSLGLHPLVVLFSMLAGGVALGMLGILIALPLTAALVILFKEFVLPALQKMADEDAPPPAAAG